MDYVGANRILALNRQIDAIATLVKKGKITKFEAEVLVAPKMNEIAKIRGQGELPGVSSEKKK